MDASVTLSGLTCICIDLLATLLVASCGAYWVHWGDDIYKISENGEEKVRKSRKVPNGYIVSLLQGKRRRSIGSSANSGSKGRRGPEGRRRRRTGDGYKGEEHGKVVGPHRDSSNWGKIRRGDG